MKTDDTDLDALLAEAMQNPTVRFAALEHNLRAPFTGPFNTARKALGLSVRETAKLLGMSRAKTRRLLGKEVGGRLSLKTLVRAADALGLELTLTVYRKAE